MKVLVFDTETTGLIPKNTKCLGDWPHIVQLSCIFINLDKLDEMFVDNFIINPDILIPKESSDIHGITNEIAAEKGINIRDALLRFTYFLDEADVIVAHNLSFDKKIIEKELERLEYPNYFNIKSYQIYDTMQKGKKLCNIVRMTKRGHSFIKFPKLIELYEYLFQPNADCYEYKNAHNAIFDVLMTFRCYLTMNEIKTKIDFTELYKKYLE
jgi:DNA polymerase III epsilon subunit-like protein